MATQDVKFIIAVEDAGAIRKLTETERALYDLQGTAKKTESTFSQLWKGFAVGQLAVSALHKGFQLIKNELASTVSESIKAEKVDRALESALQVTGQAAGGAAEHFKQYASELQKKTIYDDESIKSSQTLMISMGLSIGVMDRATKGAIGLAHVFGMDLDGAARAVALGFQGNYRAIGMLIPAVRQATTEGEKQAAMMKALNEYYQGAEAATNTYTGRVSQLKNAWGDVKEAVGEIITKSGVLLDFLKDQTAYLQSLNKETKESAFSWSAIFRAMSGGNVAGIIASTAAATGKAGLDTQILDGKLKKLAETFVNDVRPAVIPIIKQQEEVAQAFNNTSRSVTQLATDLSYLRMFGTGITGFESGAKSSTLGGMVGGDLGKIIDSFDQIEGLFENLNIAAPVRAQVNQMTDQFAGFYNGIAEGFVRAFEKFKLTAKGFADFFVAIWEGIKQAFFRIIAEMVAKFVAFKILTGLGGLIGGPIGLGMIAAGGALKFWAEGFHGIVQQPTLALVGERGPERVDVGPVNSRSGGGATNINVSIYAYDNSDMERAVRQRVVPILKEVYAHGGL